MTTALQDAPAGVFDLDVRIETEQVGIEDAACATDDGCGHTCELSACHSQR